MNQDWVALPPKSPIALRYANGFARRPLTSIHKLNECHHFHYPSVELGPVQVKVDDVEKTLPTINDVTVTLAIFSNNATWKIRRTLAEIFGFDRQLHRCVFDRRHSRLDELECVCGVSDSKEVLTTYFGRFSQLTGSVITCYPVLKFLEIDSRGHRFCAAEQSAINTPAIAAALVTKHFKGRTPEQLSIRVGDILSIIEMSAVPSNGSTWWKAKLTIPVGNHGSLDGDDDADTDNNGNIRVFQIGYFPSDCVTLFDDKAVTTPSPIAPKRLPLTAAKRIGEMVRRKVKRKEPVFSVDLVQHLQRTARPVPLILQRCVEAIEKHGIVTGIYRQCGIQSNIQKLRAKFDCGLEPNLSEFAIVRDIYSVSSLLKQYFRQLPNPLFTFELYADLIAAGEQRDERIRVECLRDVLQRLVPEHYRTARYLIFHLSRLCEQKDLTDMSSRNFAIVWAPNLFRAPPTLGEGDSHLLSGLNMHTALCHFMINHAAELFPEEQENDVFPEVISTQVNGRPLFDVPSNASLGTLSSQQSNGYSDEKAPSRWSRFIRGTSVEQLIGGLGRRQTTQVYGGSSASNTPVANIRNDKEGIKWRRSRSTDAAMRQSRSESLLSMVHRGAEGLREGVRSLAGRARSMRPYGGQRASTVETMHDSTVSTTSHLTSDVKDVAPNKSPSILRRFSHRERNGVGTPDSPRRAVYFHNDVSEHEEDEADEAVNKAAEENVTNVEVEKELVPLAERSSPVEEWSSDEPDVARSSSSSPQLEMSRYDNVTPTKDFKYIIRKDLFPTIAEDNSQ
ncbi:unnamed protein product, partial [Mesorhabditis spiculigera]